MLEVHCLKESRSLPVELLLKSQRENRGSTVTNTAVIGCNVSIFQTSFLLLDSSVAMSKRHDEQLISVSCTEQLRINVTR